MCEVMRRKLSEINICSARSCSCRTIELIDDCISSSNCEINQAHVSWATAARATHSCQGRIDV